MSELHDEAPAATEQSAANAREPFETPTVQNMGGLTLVTLTTSIPVGP